MSSAAIAVAPSIRDSAPSRRRSLGLSVARRIYALCLGLILITVAIATLGYLAAGAVREIASLGAIADRLNAWFALPVPG